MIGERGPGWGADWGTVGDIPPEARLASSDAAAADIVAEARRSGRPAPAVVLTAGDLARTLGAPASSAGGPEPAKPGAGVGSVTRLRRGRASVDLAKQGVCGLTGAQADVGAGTGVGVRADVGAVLVDGVLHWFVAHLVARRSWWRGRLLVVANASFIGHWNVAPRAHPGDGRLDTFDTRPSPAVRLAARRRLPAGTHLPHPDVVQRRTKATQFTLDPSLDVYLDGRRVARASTLSVRVEPASLQVWIPL